MDRFIIGVNTQKCSHKSQKRNLKNLPIGVHLVKYYNKFYTYKFWYEIIWILVLFKRVKRVIEHSSSTILLFRTLDVNYVLQLKINFQNIHHSCYQNCRNDIYSNYYNLIPTPRRNKVRPFVWHNLVLLRSDAVSQHHPSLSDTISYHLITLRPLSTSYNRANKTIHYVSNIIFTLFNVADTRKVGEMATIKKWKRRCY